MQIYHTIILSLATAVALPAAAATLEVSPGLLASLLTDELRKSEQITLTGSMDVRDFRTLSDLSALKSLDLSGVSIAAYTATKAAGTPRVQFDANTLPDGALLGIHLTELTLPADLTEIGTGALAGNDFTSLTIPASVTKMGSEALYDCRKLTAITLPATLKVLGENMMAGCSALKDVTAEVSYLPAGAFMRCTALTSVTLPSGLTSIGNAAFAGCSALQEISLPAGLKSIGERAFALTGLKEITLPASVTEAGEYAFALCPELSSASLLSMPEMGDGLFYYDPKLSAVDFTSETPIAFPDYLFTGSAQMAFPEGLEGVSSLGRYALKDNQSAALSLGSGLGYLGDGALEGMTGLTELDVQALGTNVPELGKDVFAGINQADVTLTTAEDEPTAPWESAGQWKEFRISAYVGVSTPMPCGLR